MKKTFLMLTALASVVACNQKPDYAILSGKVTNPADAKLFLLYNNKMQKEIVLNQDGTFLDTIQGVTGKNFYLLSAQRRTIPLFLQEGTNLVIEYQDDITNSKVSGVDAEKTQYLLERNKSIDEAINLELFTKSPNDFKKGLKEILDAGVKKAEPYKFDQAFLQNQQKWADSYFILLSKQYPQYYKMATKSEQEVELPEDFYAESKNMDFDVANDYENIETYRQLVNAHFFEMITDPSNQEQINQLFSELKALKSDNIRDEISKSLVSLISVQNPNNQLIVDFINENVSDVEVKQEANTTFENVKKIMKGQPSPTFTYENYNGGKTSLEDLKGKVVYVDVWATWCRPCLMELPSLKELEKEFHGKNIEFVSISVDDAKDKEKWRALVERENLKGVQLFSDNSWDSQFVRDYMINGIPRFIIIDKEGNIIDADATRPSNPETKQILKSLL